VIFRIHANLPSSGDDAVSADIRMPGIDLPKILRGFP
jgi:hypothetical protein